MKTKLFENCSDLYLNTKHNVDYGICNNCGLVQQVPIPIDTQHYYPSYPMHAQRSSIYNIIRKLLLSPIYFDVPRSTSPRLLLDYGCGNGSYMDSIRNKINQVVGFEPNSNLAKMVSDQLAIPVYSDINKLTIDLKDSVDYITAHFVLEHLTNLEEAFRCFECVLKPGGILHATVPNIRSWEARLFKKYWHGLDPPRHISFPDHISLSILSKKYGLKLLKQRKAFFPNSFAGSLVTVLFGHYNHGLFLAALPLSMLISYIAPSGTYVFIIKKLLSEKEQ